MKLDNTLYNKEYNLEFWHITKNAMTSIIHELGFSWVSVSEIPIERKIFCVIRNPIDRFLSSYLMCKRLYGNNNHQFNMRKISDDKINKMFKGDIISGYDFYIDEIVNNGYFDSHNIHQTYYIDNYIEGKNVDYTRDMDNITNYILMDDLNGDLSLLFGKDIKLKSMNTSVINPMTKEKLKEVSNVNENKILFYYEKDNLLYQKIKKNRV
jgi:hypothetical protein